MRCVGGGFSPGRDTLIKRKVKSSRVSLNSLIKEYEMGSLEGCDSIDGFLLKVKVAIKNVQYTIAESDIPPMYNNLITTYTM